MMYWKGINDVKTDFNNLLPYSQYPIPYCGGVVTDGGMLLLNKVMLMMLPVILITETLSSQPNDETFNRIYSLAGYT